jgi:hypothetical protein
MQIRRSGCDILTAGMPVADSRKIGSTDLLASFLMQETA